MDVEDVIASRWGDALYDDAFGLEVGDAVVGAVVHHDRFFQKRDERAWVLEFGEDEADAADDVVGWGFVRG